MGSASSLRAAAATVAVVSCLAVSAATAGATDTSGTISNASPVGLRRFTVTSPPAGRPLEAVVWYPSTGGPTRLAGDNPIFVGEPAAIDAPISPGSHRLVLVSHGHGGNLFNQAWLASTLARAGYVVAAANHPGTTSTDMRPALGADLGERRRDLARLVAWLAAEPEWSRAVDARRVALIGHSLGGWTVMAAAGARVDLTRFRADCRDHPDLIACRIDRDLPIVFDAEATSTPALPAVAAVVTLDLGLARSFDPASLAAFAPPTLVIAAGTYGPDMDATLESGYLADNLPRGRTRSVSLEGAAHFSFLGRCKPGAAERLDAGIPAQGPLCQDGGADRASVHARTRSLVVDWLDRHFGD